MLEHSPPAQLLKNLGFRLLHRRLMPHEMYLGACRHIDDCDESFLFDATNWYITWGDHDVL